MAWCRSAGILVMVKTLVRWLATRTPEQLAGLILHRSELFSGAEPRSLDDLAHRLMVGISAGSGLQPLTVAHHQVLAASAQLITRGKDRTGGEVAPAWHDEAHVRVEDVLRALGVADPGAGRASALAAFDHLEDQLLLWPSGDAVVTLPGSVVRLFGSRRADTAPGLDRALSNGFNKESIAFIAEQLGVGVATMKRAALQQAVVSYLSSPSNIRELVGRASAGAQDALGTLLDNGGLLATRVFPLGTPYPGSKHLIELSYPDPDTVWLASHGLIVPSGEARARVPAEVVSALRGGALFAFSPCPPTVLGVEVAAEQIRGEAELALVGAVTKAGRVLSALDSQPVVPRRSGGFPVRETRRLAKAIALDEIETIFWIGLTYHAGLIHSTSERSSPVVCPTTASDGWSASSMATRASLLLRTWLGLDDIVSWWPFADETPIAYGAAEDPYAAELRRATLRALATLAPGTGCRAAGVASHTPGHIDHGVLELTTAAHWFAPMAVGEDAQMPVRVCQTLYEAQLLGVVAHGALTDVGRALLAGDDAALGEALTDLLPAEQTIARFQADMTVVVGGPPTTDLARLLGSVADRESEGHAVVFRISASSVRRALDNGADTAELLERLEAVADGGLPQVVRYQVAEAGRAHGRIRVVSPASCIRSDDETLVAELMKAKGLVELGLRLIAPTVLVSAKPPAETLAALRNAGYAPALEGTSGATVVERTRGRRAMIRQRKAPKMDMPAHALTVAQRLLRRAAPAEATLWD